MPRAYRQLKQNAAATSRDVRQKHMTYQKIQRYATALFSRPTIENLVLLSADPETFHTFRKRHNATKMLNFVMLGVFATTLTLISLKAVFLSLQDINIGFYRQTIFNKTMWFALLESKEHRLDVVTLYLSGDLCLFNMFIVVLMS